MKLKPTCKKNTSEQVKTSNEIKAEMRKCDNELKTIIQAECTKVNKALTEHMELCKAQIEKAKTEMLSNIGQLHEHVDTRFTAPVSYTHLDVYKRQ